MDLAERLRERRDEIEQTLLARVAAVADPAEVDDPEYRRSLRKAVAAGLDYAIEVVENGERDPPPVPQRLLRQARLAAHSGVSLDKVLRRYSSCHTLLADFLIAEEGDRVTGPELKQALGALSSAFDGLVATVADEYARACMERPRTAEGVRAREVTKLLAGRPVEAATLGYELDGWHLAAVAAGPGAAEGLLKLAAGHGCRSLLVRRAEGRVWAWLGGNRRLPSADALRTAERALPATVVVAFGEPGGELEGWRLTHRQAMAAFGVIERSSEKRVRYAKVALHAAALRDDLLRDSLRRIFLDALAEDRDGGFALRSTLRTYFRAQRNVSSTAATLGVSRKTVTTRLRQAEERIGGQLLDYAPQLQTALELWTADQEEGSTTRSELHRSGLSQ